MHTSCFLWTFMFGLILLSIPSVVHNYPSSIKVEFTTTTIAQTPATDTVANYNGEIFTSEIIASAVAKAADLCVSQQCRDNINYNNITHVVSSNEDNVPKMLAASADDLIYPVKGPTITVNSTTAYQKIDLLTSAEEEVLLKSAEPEHTQHDAYLFKPINSSAINMGDFVALIPASRVQTIVTNYYLHDAEVKRAYDFFNSPQFVELKQQVISAPEIVKFLQFLNNNDLDLMSFIHTLANIISLKPTDIEKVAESDQKDRTFDTENASAPSNSAEENIESTTEALEQLNGLQGFVDSILSVIPQDEVITTFFDKLENEPQFSQLVNKVGTPKFTEVLTDLQHSDPLRNLIYTLHNNGIYIAKVMESLRAYFFLGNI